jgi:UDP-N-acetylmuramoylalanine--D-glutamate ligase
LKYEIYIIDQNKKIKMIFNKHYRVGVWGFGIVGKSVVDYLYSSGYKNIIIMDKRIPNNMEYDYINKKNILWYNQENEEEDFFNSCEIIIPSPGINITPQCYATHKSKWLHELDIFYNNFKKPIIAITGSIGKTSTVHILEELFKAESIPVAVGGNIGIPMLDLLTKQNAVDYALLEVSSFQLLHCTNFTPYLGIITNIYPNHLDYHATEEEYYFAKLNIIRFQKEHMLSLIPFALREKDTFMFNNHLRAYFTHIKPNNHELITLTSHERVYYIESNIVMRYTNNTYTPIMELTIELSKLSFIDNILLIASVCDLMHINPKTLQHIASKIILPEHRIEKIYTFNNVEFYNDSKATTTASTLAAVKKLHNRPLHLFLGGLSKGVDRAPFIAQLKNHVKHIYCFGKEATTLYTMCINNNISATYFPTLDDAIHSCTPTIKPGDCVLLSPAGSSYDLYENYEERGKHFKELITHYIRNSSL